ncbi:MAG: DUF6262 family protein [Nostoc sp. DedSLP03]|uniref:DUF6262 family protein n=1 Tax=Nostoc sp. DedSLP03 TaxID=3075400 RepID=UPI002AD3E17B|nr:DUF6262 family protein [Nostoc sp. DedSLP03]MDZ7965544.1 DUF6262 family protein [Nostoc sp. DedSLP03]
MTVERNIDGLRGNAQRKRQEAFEKVEQGIQKLIKEQKVINFNTVAKASGLSKAWLYKEPEIKARIEHLRENNSKTKEIPPKQRSSDASKDAIIKTLKERIKRVEAENRGLRDQHEAIYGRILQASEIEHRLERLEAENTKLKKELEECLSRSTKPLELEKSTFTTIPTKGSKGEISSTIRDELAALGIKLTSPLASKIRDSTEEIVLTAIEALKEQLQHGPVRRPGGWLSSAIDDAWQPNQPLGEETHVADTFSQWYGLAREFGIVIGSRKDDDGSIWVQENTGHWFPFEQFSSKWTFEYLRSKKIK